MIKMCLHVLSKHLLNDHQLQLEIKGLAPLVLQSEFFAEMQTGYCLNKT